MTGVLSADGLDAIAALRRDLFSEGYRPVTVVSHDGDPNRSPGKRPTGLGWQHRARRTPPEAAVLQPRGRLVTPAYSATNCARSMSTSTTRRRPAGSSRWRPRCSGIRSVGPVTAPAAACCSTRLRRHAWEAGDRIRRWQDRGARTRLPVRGLWHALYRCAVIVARRFAVERAS